MNLQVGEGAVHGGADAAHRVAEVEDGRIRADRMISAQISRMGGMMRSEWKRPPGPPFSPYTCCTPYCCGMRQSCSHSSKRLPTSIEMMRKSAPRNASCAVRGGRDGEGQIMLRDERAGRSPRRRPSVVRVDVVQHDVAAFQHLALQDIADGAVAELGAPCADQNDPLSHVVSPDAAAPPRAARAAGCVRQSADHTEIGAWCP